jgi:hypothetical protein
MENIEEYYGPINERVIDVESLKKIHTEALITLLKQNEFLYRNREKIICERFFHEIFEGWFLFDEENEKKWSYLITGFNENQVDEFDFDIINTTLKMIEDVEYVIK